MKTYVFIAGKRTLTIFHSSKIHWLPVVWWHGLALLFRMPRTVDESAHAMTVVWAHWGPFSLRLCIAHGLEADAMPRFLAGKRIASHGRSRPCA